MNFLDLGKLKCDEILYLNNGDKYLDTFISKLPPIKTSNESVEKICAKILRSSRGNRTDY